MQWRSTGGQSEAAVPSPLHPACPEPASASAWHSEVYGAALRSAAGLSPALLTRACSHIFSLTIFNPHFASSPFSLCSFPLSRQQNIKKSAPQRAERRGDWWEGQELAAGAALTCRGGVLRALNFPADAQIKPRKSQGQPLNLAWVRTPTTRAAERCVGQGGCVTGCRARRWAEARSAALAGQQEMPRPLPVQPPWLEGSRTDTGMPCSPLPPRGSSRAGKRGTRQRCSRQLLWRCASNHEGGKVTYPTCPG